MPAAVDSSWRATKRCHQRLDASSRTPIARLTRPGATSCVVPRPRLNQPSPVVRSGAGPVGVGRVEAAAPVESVEVGRVEIAMSGGMPSLPSAMRRPRSGVGFQRATVPRHAPAGYPGTHGPHGAEPNRKPADGGVAPMRVVVIGATGNVGTSLLGALTAAHQGQEIVGVARRRPELELPRTRWVTADVTRDDLVPHLA